MNLLSISLLAEDIMRFIHVLYYNSPSVSLFDISSLAWAFRAQLFGIFRVWSKTQLIRMRVGVS